MDKSRLRSALFASAAILAVLPAGHGLAQEPKTPDRGSATGAGDIANFFSQVGNQIYQYCIFELSQEQLEVQQALIEAYIKQGASNALARQLAVKQIQPPRLSDECQQIKKQSKAPPPISISTPWIVTSRKIDAGLAKALAQGGRAGNRLWQTRRYCRNGTAPRASTTSRFNTGDMRES